MSLTFTKYFIIAYAFTFVITSFFGIPLNFALSPIPSTDVLTIFPNILIFLINLITFTTEYVIINIIIWIARFIVLLELLPLIIELIGSIGKSLSGLAGFFT